MNTPHSPTSGGLIARLAKTRRQLADGVAGLLSAGGGPGRHGDEAFDDLHDQLLLADVGVEASERIISRLKATAPDNLTGALRAALTEILEPCEQPLQITTAAPFVILMVGVNGAGKTTTLAKLAARLKDEGRSVMFAACDTFRAAAVEQLQIWGRRLDAPVIAPSQEQERGADAAAVAHDAVIAARARRVDVLLIDTAGRQHTRDDLMAQLGKIRRVLGQLDPQMPHETLLTVDAGVGQNALSQVEHFRASAGVGGLGLCVAKLDGTAKGGVVVALAERFALPIRFVGVGQDAADLRPFVAAEFAAALVDDNSESESQPAKPSRAVAQ